MIKKGNGLLLCLILLFITGCVSFLSPDQHSLDNPILKEDRELYFVNQNNIKSSYDVKISNLLPVRINRVIDGNTLVVDILNPPMFIRNREIIRLAGVNITEEGYIPGRRQIQQPTSRFSQRSVYITKELTEGKIVYLAFDSIPRDREGRLYVYLYFNDGDCLNTLLIRQGLARVEEWYSFHYFEEYLRYENYARNTKTGVW